MKRFTVQRYCARNDQNGNPRRVYVIRDSRGTIVATVDEGYEGRTAAYRVLRALGSGFGDYGRPYFTDLGDVDVAPGIYRRMLKWTVTKP